MDERATMQQPGKTEASGAWSEEHARALQLAAARAIEFRRTLHDRPQRPEKTYAEMRALFRKAVPEKPVDTTALIEELVALAEQGLGAMAGPRFFGWVIGSSHPAGVAADWLTSAWGQNVGGHTPTPAAAACEEIAAAWLLELLDLPPQCSVGFVTGATLANFTCLAAARGEVLRRAGWDVEARGLFSAPEIHVFLGAEAHSSIFSALQFLGLGQDRVTLLPVDSMGRIELHAFRSEFLGKPAPKIVILQAGHVNSGAFDPIAEIAALAHAHDAWVHVDGAFGLWARASAETAALAEGCDLADSWATDGHKWLQTPYDTGYAIVRDPGAHARAMTNTASYLPQVAEGERNPSYFVPELSRRARGFPTWAVIRALGRQGIAEMIARHCRYARNMAAALRSEPGIFILNDVVLNQLAVRFGTGEAGEKGDRLTDAVIARVQARGECFAAGARWRGRAIMRLSVISSAMGDEDVGRSLAAIIDAWRDVRTA
jgi:glutamate/tyrosine decarboxylase-like PLP-dependent enzyme